MRKTILFASCVLLASTETLAFDPHLPVGLYNLQHHVSLLQQTVTPFLSHNHDVPNHIIQHHATTNTLASASASASTTSPQDLLSTLYSKYRQALLAKPFQTKIVTGCTLAVVADGIAQLREPEYNLKRAASFVAFDGCWRAVQVLTYKPLIETCTGQFSWKLLQLLPFFSQQQQVDTFLLGAMEQTLFSQLVLIPLIYYPVFYASTGLVQGLTVDEMLTRARETFIPLMKRNLMFWIPTQFAVFGFVEENLQIPILIVCGLVWTVILSLSAGNASEEQQPQPTVALVDGGMVESTMAELGAVEAAMGLNNTGFFYGANVPAYYDDEDLVADGEAPSIKTISNLRSSASSSEQEVSQ